MIHYNIILTNIYIYIYIYIFNLKYDKISKEYPLYKILRGIVKKFMLNELEIIFFLHIIQDCGWNYHNELVTSFEKEFNCDFLNIIHEVKYS